MYDEVTRSMNEQERTLLNELVANAEPPVTLVGTVKWVFVWIAGLVLCGFVVAVLVSLGVHPVIHGVLGGLVGIFAMACLYAIIVLIGSHRHWSRFHREFLRETIPKIQQALQDGNVFVKRVSASAVIQIVEFEDEGSGYIFDVGDGRILFLKGQRFYPANEHMSWPNSEFEIVRTVLGDIWVGIFCSGDELTPLRKLETSECVDDIVWAEREDVLNGNIEQFAHSIAKRVQTTR